MNDVNWWFNSRMFTAICILAYLMLDLFDLSQRQRFESYSYGHHILQTAYALVFYEWGPSNLFRYCFPCAGSVIFSCLHKPMLGGFALKRATHDEKLITSYAKVSCGFIISSIIGGFSVMIVRIINNRALLPLPIVIVQNIMFFGFVYFDFPLFVHIYRDAFNNDEEKGPDDGQSFPTSTKEILSIPHIDPSPVMMTDASSSS